MSQASPSIGANKSGLSYRQEDNDGKKALLNHHKGASAPAYAEAGMMWLDDSATPWALKMHDGADWIILGMLNAGSNSFQPYQGTAALKFLPYAADTGSANAYTVAPTPAPAAYSAGLVVMLKPANACTGAATINVGGLGAKNIKMPDGSDTGANSLISSAVYLLVYDGASFVIVNPTLAANFLLARGSALASSATVDVGGATSDYVEVSGTTTITSLGSGSARNHVWVKFQSALILTHSATSLILPTSANITTAAGDIAEFVRISGANWQCLGYIPATGKPLVPPERADLPAGSIVQVAYAAYTSSADLATTIPLDDTIPQNTEGTEILTVTITPSSASSVLEIQFNGFASGSSAAVFTAALFRDSTASAICTQSSVPGGVSLPTAIGLLYYEAAGSTVARTYKIRAGLNSGTTRMNGSTSARFFGGTAQSVLTVREIRG
ncbi:MAG: hypothetical protein PW788_02670 [Micavibrio sp.]|nr:hypothetical protein [Micavibrio sp.]